MLFIYLKINHNFIYLIQVLIKSSYLLLSILYYLNFKISYKLLSYHYQYSMQRRIHYVNYL